MDEYCPEVDGVINRDAQLLHEIVLVSGKRYRNLFQLQIGPSFALQYAGTRVHVKSSV